MSETNAVDAEVVKVLSRSKFCEGLDAGLVGVLAAAFKSSKVPAGTQFINHDAQTKELYVIAAGLVDIEIPVPGNQALTSIARLKQGDTVGELALLRDARRSATAKAISEVTLLSASSEEVVGIFDRHPAIGYIICRNLARVLADRLHDTNMQLRSELSRS